MKGYPATLTRSPFHLTPARPSKPRTNSPFPGRHQVARRFLRPAPLLLLLCALALGASAYEDHWNSGTGGKPSRNGLVWERGPTTTNLLWWGSWYSTDGFPPVMEGNTVVMTRLLVATSDIAQMQQSGTIVAHNLTTGAILWTKQLPIDFPATDWYSGVRAIRDKRVYVTRSGNDNPSYVYALDAITGNILWRSQDTFDIGTIESPAFAPNGDLVVGSRYDLTRINPTNGLRIWNTPRTAPGDGAEPALSGSHIYVWELTGNGPTISSFDLATGARLYASPPLPGALSQNGLFVGPDATVYVPAYHTLIAFKDNGAALLEKWRVPMPYLAFASFGVGPDGSVYAYSPDYRVIRIRPDDGAVTASSQILSANDVSPRMAIDSSGILFVSNGGFADGALFSFNPDLTTRWIKPIPYLAYGGPAIGRNGTLVACGNSTRVFAYRGNSDGLPGPPIQLTRDTQHLTITYSGTLQSATNLSGPWTPVSGASTPWSVPPDKTHEFFRASHE